MSACITVSIPSNEIDVLVGRECDSDTFDIEIPVGGIDVLIEKPVEGERGTQGPPGPGVVDGGTVGQVLAKKTGDDYDTEWINLPLSLQFESVSKNLASNPYILNYTSGALTSIVYTVGAGSITKTLNYTTGKLTSIVLSGNTPSGIALTKTLTYTGDSLTGVSYS